jgi:hypothetical protein
VGQFLHRQAPLRGTAELHENFDPRERDLEVGLQRVEDHRPRLKQRQPGGETFAALAGPFRRGHLAFSLPEYSC